MQQGRVIVPYRKVIEGLSTSCKAFLKQSVACSKKSSALNVSVVRKPCTMHGIFCAYTFSAVKLEIMNLHTAWEGQHWQGSVLWDNLPGMCMHCQDTRGHHACVAQCPRPS